MRDKYKGPILGDWKCAYRVSTSTPLLFSNPHSSAETRIQFPFASPLSGFNVILFRPLIRVKCLKTKSREKFIIKMAKINPKPFLKLDEKPDYFFIL